MRRVLLVAATLALVAVPPVTPLPIGTGFCGAAKPNLLSAVTFDGAVEVRVHYAAAQPQESESAPLLLEGALRSYQVHVAEWGFASRDPDKVWHLSINEEESCRWGEQEMEYGAPLLDTVATNRFEDPAVRAERYHLFNHHEVDHHFVLSDVEHFGRETEWSQWGWLENSFALTTEMWFSSDLTFEPDSRLYQAGIGTHPLGIGALPLDYDFGSDLNQPTATHRHALLLGYLAAHNGDVAFAHNLFHARRDLGPATAPAAQVEGVFNQALSTSLGAHDSFREAMTDFAFDLVRRQGFEWGAPNGTGVHDWLAFVPPVKRQGPVDFLHPFAGRVGSWGIQFVSLAAQAADRVVVAPEGPGDAIDAFLYVRDGDTWARLPFDTTTVIPPGSHDELVLGVLRSAPVGTAYSVAVVPGGLV